MELDESFSEIKRRLAYLLREYVDVSVGEVRETFFVSGAEVGAVEWEGNRIYVALPLVLVTALNELIREGRVRVRPYFGTEDFILIETSRRAFIFKQPAGAYLTRDGHRVPMDGRDVGLLFQIVR